MRGQARVRTCLVAVVLAGGCGGDSPKPAAAPASLQHLGKASAGQKRRARRYTTCLAKRIKKRQLAFQKGTGTSPPVIRGAISGTRFGISLSSGPTGAKRIEKKLRKRGNNALYRRGSTVIGFAGRKPRPADVTLLTNCADKIG